MAVVSHQIKQCPGCEKDLEKILAQMELHFCPGCRFPLRLIDGKYRIDRQLGRGGFGLVYLAHHLGLDTPHVIKFLKAEYLELEDLQEVGERFLREVKVTAALSRKSAHIVQVYDVCEDAEMGPYYTMEYLRGSTLQTYLYENKKVSLATIFEIFEQLALCVAIAHQNDIVHRDLKPENIFVVKRESSSHFVKVIDFGIAKALGGTLSSATASGLWGTPVYMSPEQCKNISVDGRSDIYSLGCILYELLTGAPPFVNENPSALLVAHLLEDPAPLKSADPDEPWPQELDAVVRQALTKEPKDRYQHVVHFWQALQPFDPREKPLYQVEKWGEIPDWPEPPTITLDIPKTSTPGSKLPSGEGLSSEVTESVGAELAEPVLASSTNLSQEKANRRATAWGFLSALGLCLVLFAGYLSWNARLDASKKNPENIAVNAKSRKLQANTNKRTGSLPPTGQKSPAKAPKKPPRTRKKSQKVAKAKLSKTSKSKALSGKRKRRIRNPLAVGSVSAGSKPSPNIPQYAQEQGSRNYVNQSARYQNRRQRRQRVQRRRRVRRSGYPYQQRQQGVKRIKRKAKVPIMQRNSGPSFLRKRKSKRVYRKKVQRKRVGVLGSVGSKTSGKGVFGIGSSNPLGRLGTKNPLRWKGKKRLRKTLRKHRKKLRNLDAKLEALGQNLEQNTNALDPPKPTKVPKVKGKTVYRMPFGRSKLPKEKIVLLFTYDKYKKRYIFQKELARLGRRIEQELDLLIAPGFSFRGVTKSWQKFVYKRAKETLGWETQLKKHGRIRFHKGTRVMKDLRITLYPRAVGKAAYQAAWKGESKKTIAKLLVKIEQKSGFFKKDAINQ